METLAVAVHGSDFFAALRTITPSVSREELVQYEEMRARYTK